jgi:hypothetical protein
MKIGISGAVGIGKTYFVNSLDNSVFLAVDEAARQVNAMYPDKEIGDLREIIFHHQVAVEEVVDKLTEDVIAVCDRTVVDNLVFLNIFSGKEIAESKKNFVKSEYLNGLKKYDALYYFDYGGWVDADLLKNTLSDSFRIKTLGKFIDDDIFYANPKFKNFNENFKNIFLKTADELGIPVKIIETDYIEEDLQDRNKTLQEELLNNFLGV